MPTTPVYVNAYRLTAGVYVVIDRHLKVEVQVRSTSAASALRRYLGQCTVDHPFVDAPIESIQHGNYAMTV